MVQYQFDWNASGSHYYSPWTSFFASGVTGYKTRYHQFPAGTYLIKVRARDIHGLMSDWSDGLTVVIT